jgi:hypothetical protein
MSRLGFAWAAPLAATLAATLAGSTGVAQADNGPYVGVGATQVELDDIYGVDLHLHHPVPKFIAGFRIIDFLGVEVNYADLGSQNATLLGPSDTIGYAHADAREFSAYAMGYLPLPFVDLFAKAGLMHWQLTSNAQVAGTPLYSVDTSGQEFAYGLGGQLTFGPFAPRLEWEHSNVPYTGGLNLWTLGLTFTF